MAKLMKYEDVIAANRSVGKKECSQVLQIRRTRRQNPESGERDQGHAPQNLIIRGPHVYDPTPKISGLCRLINGPLVFEIVITCGQVQPVSRRMDR